MYARVTSYAGESIRHSALNNPKFTLRRKPNKSRVTQRKLTLYGSRLTWKLNSSTCDGNSVYT